MSLLPKNVTIFDHKAWCEKYGQSLDRKNPTKVFKFAQSYHPYGGCAIEEKYYGTFNASIKKLKPDMKTMSLYVDVVTFYCFDFLDLPEDFNENEGEINSTSVSNIAFIATHATDKNKRERATELYKKTFSTLIR
jgi:hypothetical protein